MVDQELLERIADKYRREGFEVIVHPTHFQPAVVPRTEPKSKPSRLPGRPNRCLQSQWRGFRRGQIKVEFSAEFGVERCRGSLSEEAGLLLNPLTAPISPRDGPGPPSRPPQEPYCSPAPRRFRGHSPKKILEELLSKGLINPTEFNVLQQSLYTRNVIAHGGRPEELPPELASSVLAVAKRLLQAGRRDIDHSAPGIRSAFYRMVRKAVNQSKFRTLVDRATEV